MSEKEIKSSPIEYIPVLDGVRGFALLIIFLRHSLAFTRLEPDPYSVFEKFSYFIGDKLWCAVDLFFVLSGFLITSILLTTKQSNRYFYLFYSRRTIRIFPIYFIFLIFMLLLVPLFISPLPDDWPKTFGEQIWYWVYLTNIKAFLTNTWLTDFLNHAWSLAVEEQFYLVWPLLVFLLPTKRIAHLCWFFFLSSIALRYGLYMHGKSIFAIRAFTPARLDTLCMGALIAVIKFQDGIHSKNWQRLKIFAPSIALLLLIPSLFTYKKYYTSVYFYSFFAFSFGYLIMKCVEAKENSGLYRFFNLKFLKKVGLYSYSCYLIHQPIYVILVPYIRDYVFIQTGSMLLVWGTAFILMTPLCLFLGWISYHLIEKKFLKLKIYFKY